MKRPKIGIILTPEGVESVSLLGGSEERIAANNFFSALKEELADLELIIQQKFSEEKFQERVN